MKKMPGVWFMCKISVEIKKKLQKAAESRMLSMSDVVREAISEHLKKY